MKKLLLGLILISTSLFANQYLKIVNTGGMEAKDAEVAINKVIRQEQDGPGMAILTDIRVENKLVYLIFTDDK